MNNDRGILFHMCSESCSSNGLAPLGAIQRNQTEKLLSRIHVICPKCSHYITHYYRSLTGFTAEGEIELRS